MADVADDVPHAGSRRSAAVLARLPIIALYLLSPALALIDWKFGLNLRVPTLLDRPGWWVGYYLIATLLGVVMALLPRRATLPLAVLESGANLGLNAAGLMVWYVGILERATAGAAVAAGGEVSGEAAGPFNVLGFAVSLGTIFVCYLAWQIADHRDESSRP